MLSNRGRWILLLAITGAALGLLRRQETLAYSCMLIVIWLFIEWIVFVWRVEVTFRHLRVERRINDNPKLKTLWMGRPANVRTRLVGTNRKRLPWIHFRDFLPSGLEVVSDTDNLASVSGKSPLETSIDYTINPRAAGRMVLPGVTAQIADLSGMFYAQRFLKCETTFKVMPACAVADAMRPLTKLHNALLPPGNHRFLRAGAGAELLELREYVPGDPPKSIAWKVSARKDCLMTRQYESEVPVRMTLFLDGSAAARLGTPGHRPIDQLIAVGAAISRAALAERDPVGLVQFNDVTSTRLKHGGGERQLYRVLGAMADMSLSGPPAGSRVFDKALFDETWSLAEDLHPELLRPSVNRLPLMIFPLWIPKRLRFRRRMQLATLLGDLYDLPADATVRLAWDDVAMTKYAHRFLDGAGRPWRGRIFTARGTNTLATPRRLETLATAMTRSVAMTRDNEVFVLLTDLLDHSLQLDRLREAIRVARARRNRVVIICPCATDFGYGNSEAPTDLMMMARKAERLRLREAVETLREKVRGLGVPIAFATDTKAIQLVLNEACISRSGRSTRAGAV